MGARVRGVCGAAVVLGILGGAWGCSLVTNLDVSGYTGLDGGGARDSSSSSALCLADVCFAPSCSSPADCEGGDMCCVIENSPTSYSTACCSPAVKTHADAAAGGD
jgi:hypothetical protein